MLCSAVALSLRYGTEAPKCRSCVSPSVSTGAVHAQEGGMERWRSEGVRE